MQLLHATAAAERVSQQPDKLAFVRNFTRISVILVLSEANPGRKLGSTLAQVQENAEMFTTRGVHES